MKFRFNLKPLLELSVMAVLAFVAHQAVIYFSDADQTKFYYSIPTLYLLFYIASAVIVGVLSWIRRKNLDNVGYAFMLLTCIKMVYAYLLLRPVLQSLSPQAGAEKISFFAVFIVFLMLETIITARLVNK